MRHRDLKRWTMGLVRVFAAAPGGARLGAMCQWLAQICPVDHFVSFVYEGDHRPLALFDTFPPDKRRIYVDDYQVGPYLLDPFYLACAGNRPPGLWRLRQIAPDHFYLGEYYLTYYQQTGLTEEIGFLVEVGAGARAVLSLMRSAASPAFSNAEMKRIECAGPVVEEVVREAWQHFRSVQQRPEQDLDFKVREAFDQFGAQVLTAREREIVQLLLRGHSSASVAAILAIRPGTVKIHRKNIYAKLGIGSQSELLGLFVRDLGGYRPQLPETS